MTAAGSYTVYASGQTEVELEISDGIGFRHTSTTIEEKEISILITPKLWVATPEKQ
jgi:hypothetical protein